MFQDWQPYPTMLELISIRKLRFYGEIQSHAVRDWMLTGKLGATVTQPLWDYIETCNHAH